MAIWKEQNSSKNEPMLASQVPSALKDDGFTSASAPFEGPRRFKEREPTESVIGADLTIEGKIEGSGHVRLVGKFKGDVQVEGNLTIEEGAKLTGSVRASTVVIAGELEGNIEAASSVELQKTGVLKGDLKTGSVMVAAGSRMRGQADFGWEEEPRRETRIKEPRMKVETASAVS
jgi:cytoskeletal protein CcmA (bactofilin family)